MDIQLAYSLIALQRKTENSVYRGRFDNRAERLIEVNARSLMKSIRNKSRFIPLDKLIGESLNEKHPFISYQILHRV